MRIHVAPLVIVAAVLGAAGLSLLHADAAPATKTEPAPPPAAADMPASPALPPNHPPIGAGAPHGMQGAPSADEPPAITWTVPQGWQTATNPSTMRIATYHPSPETEVSVARAGGTTEANIERWLGQFDDRGQDKRTARVVHGVDVAIVEVSGTYGGGSMTAGAPQESHPGWTLVGAVVDTADSHYFFKLLGPTERVHAARASFDVLVASIAPR